MLFRSGPRTAAGRETASRKALRHGLSAVVHRQPAPSAELERLAKAICGHKENRLCSNRLVAANELVLRAINVQKIAAVERLRDPTAITLAKRDNSMKLATARFLQAWLTNREIEALVPKVLEKYKDQLPPPVESSENLPAWMAYTDDIAPIRLKALLEEPSDSIEVEKRALDLARKQIEEQQRDEFEAMEAVALDLIRLDRYERRTWSRQKRAIRAFLTMKIDACAGRCPLAGKTRLSKPK